MVAVTNSKGLALVTGLLPYQLNQLTLDADLLATKPPVSATFPPVADDPSPPVASKWPTTALQCVRPVVVDERNHAAWHRAVVGPGNRR